MCKNSAKQCILRIFAEQCTSFLTTDKLWSLIYEKCKRTNSIYSSNEIKSALTDIEGQSDQFKLLNVDYQWNFERSNGESDDEGLDDPALLNRSAVRPASTSTSTPRATPSLTAMSSMDPPSTDANFLDRSTADSLTR
jgi:hypothetical protein